MTEHGDIDSGLQRDLDCIERDLDAIPLFVGESWWRDWARTGAWRRRAAERFEREKLKRRAVWAMKALMAEHARDCPEPNFDNHSPKAFILCDQDFAIVPAEKKAQ